MESLHDLYAACPLTHPDSLRLLRRVPINASPQSESLHFTLQAFEPEERPPYIALSYTWGSPFRDSARRDRYEDNAQKCAVYCNDTEVEITPNLYDALRHVEDICLHSNDSVDVDGSFFKDLHSPYELNWEVAAARPWILSAPISSANLDLDSYFWVDAICINQADKQEKAYHVSDMNHVYANAKKVLAWVGPESVEDRKALELFNMYIPRLAAWKETSCPNRHKLTPEDLEKAGLGNPRIYAEAYTAFFERSYFYRAWIQQELVLARNLTILCGRKPIRLVHLEYFMDVILDSDTVMGNRHKPAPSWEAFGDTCGGRLATTQFLRILKIAKPQNIVTRILKGTFGITQASQLRAVMCVYLPCYYKRFECIDARDKLFAGLGLLELICPPAGNQDALNADYTESTEELYTKWVTVHLTISPLLHILSWVDMQSNPTISSLPSWVPDFHAHHAPGPNPSRHNAFNASRWNESVLMNRRITGKHLHLLAKRLCIIETVVQESLTDIIKDRADSLILLLIFCAGMDHTYFNGQDRVTALWRTLICNMGKSLNSKEPYPAHDEYELCFSGYILSTLGKALHDCLERKSTGEQQPPILGVFKSIHLALDELATSHPEHNLPTVDDVVTYASERRLSPDLKAYDRQRLLNYGDFGRQTAFEHELSECARKRRLFRSTEGLIGLCPVPAQPQDELWILREAKDLYVLRKDETSGQYRLVGECYVHGYMDGEAITGEADEFEEICLV